MEIFQFQDGTIYHDTTWNEMQRKIYREFKERDVLNQYKIENLGNDYEYFIYDSLIDTDNLDPSSTANFNPNKLVIETSSNARELITQNYTINNSTDTCYLTIDVIGDETTLTYQVSIDDGSVWQDITSFQDVVLSNVSNQFKFKINIPANSGLEINHFALFLNKV